MQKNTTGDEARLANAVSDILGSLRFLVSCVGLILIYIAWNCGLIPFFTPFDPSPFNILDTILSVFAIVLSISVLISQKRLRKQEKIREQVEFEVNIRAENEITKILEMLHEIQQKLGIQRSDKDLEEMKKELDIKAIEQDIKEKQT